MAQRAIQAEDQRLATHFCDWPLISIQPGLSLLMTSRISRSLVLALLLGSATHSFAQGATSPEQLAQAYAAALRSQNQKAFVELFALAKEQDRTGVEQQFRRQSQLRLESTKIVPFAVHEQRYKKAMARMGKSDAVPPEAWAEIVFAPAKQSTGAIEQETVSLAVVRRDGRYFIGW